MSDHWIGWLQEKQRHFFYGVLVVVCSIFIAFQVFGTLHKAPHTRHLALNQAFDNWMLHGLAFESLQEALSQNPELASKYSARIADKLIAQNEGQKASSIAQNVFKRVFEQTPQHTSFAEGSLLIAQGAYHEALKEAISLKTTSDPATILYGFNLIRIASLYRQLEARDQELAALDDLELYLKSNQKSASTLTDCFSEGNITLSDYIDSRKK